MWPGQMNYCGGYGQPPSFPVFPSQDHTQQDILQITSQAKGDVFLAQPNAMSHHPQYQMQTGGREQVMTIHEPCYVRLANPSQSGDGPLQTSAQDSFIFQIIPKSVGGVSGHPKNPQYVGLQHAQQGPNPILQVQQGLNTNLQAQQRPNPSLQQVQQCPKPNLQVQQCPKPNLQVQQCPKPNLQVQQCLNPSLQAQQGPNSSSHVQGPNPSLQVQQDRNSSSYGCTSSRQDIVKMEDPVTSSSSPLDVSPIGMGITLTGMGITPTGMGDMPSTTYIPVCQSVRIQTVLTLQWLMENYETHEGYSVPRCFVYDQYIEFCASNSFDPINPATFGKLIRQVFINLKTRRLGIRGQSKYHYYGIRVKHTSKLSHSEERITPESKVSKCWTVPSKVKGITDNKVAPDDQQHQPAMDFNRKNSPVSEPVDRSLSPVTALGLALLPQFPKAYMLKSLPCNADIHEVDKFLAEYRTHCEYLLEAILKGKFSEIYSQMKVFWQNFSAQNLQLLHMHCLAGTIKFCDILLYKTIISILIPGTTQEVPQSLLKAVRIFAKDFRSKLSKYIQELPRKVFEAKNEAASSFVKLLVRKSTLSHIAQATRTILNNSRAVKMMRADWREKTDLENLRRQINWLIVDVHIDEDRPDLYSYFQEFDALLEQLATVEQHVEWLDGVLKSFIEKTSESEEKAMQNFLLYVSSISELVLRDHTLRSASSFGSYHLLHMLYNEYILYRIEATTMENDEQHLMIQQIGQEYSERYSDPQLEKAVSVVYSELNNGGVKALHKDVEPVRSPNTSGLCIAEDIDEVDDSFSTHGSGNGELNATTSGSSVIKLDDDKKVPVSSSTLIDVHASQLPTAISEESHQEPKPLPLTSEEPAGTTLGNTGCDSALTFPIKHLSPHPQRVVIAGKTALVPPELMSKTPSYVAARVIKMQPKFEEGSKVMTGQTRKICKVNLSPEQANNLVKGQLIDAEDGAQFIVNEVHRLPKRISTTVMTSPPTLKPTYNSPAKVYHSL